MSSEEKKDVREPNTKWLDKEFLETAIRSWVKDPEITVTEFTFAMATSKGDNYGSDMFRITVKLEQKKYPISIIIKRFYFVDIYGEDVLTTSTEFTRERRMLGEVLPEMHDVLKKVIPDVEPFGPYFIYATASELLMEDLMQGGFQMAQRRLGLDLNHCSLVLRTLARYHAASIYLMEHRLINFSVFEKNVLGEERDTMQNFYNGTFSAPEVVTPLKNYSRQPIAVAQYCTQDSATLLFYSTIRQPNYQPTATKVLMTMGVSNTALGGMLRTLSEELKNMETLEKYSSKLSALADKDFLSLLCHLVDDHDDGDFLVLSHGDLWVNNILFRYSSSGELDGIRFVDFQGPSITSPCIDIQYFLTTSSNEKVRTTCTDQLIEEYHETLCKTLADLKCSTKPPTIEKLKEDYHKKSLYGMYAAFNILPVLLAEPGQFDLMDVSQTGKPQRELFSRKSYKNALEWFLPLYESKGFL